MQPTHRNAQLDELKDAFETFNQVSDDLQSSYRELQQQVTQLKSQLRVANRERAAEAERNAELAQRLTALLEALPGGVVMLDEDGVIREINSTANDFFGTPLQDVEWTLVCRRAFHGEACTHGDLALSDGRMVSLAQKELMPGPGRVLLFTDVTERRKVQDILARQKRLTAMGEMAAALAHQIRTPLSAALLYTTNAASAGVSAEHKDALLENATQCLQNLEQLIGDMLHFARGARYDEASFSVDELIDSIDNALRPLVSRGQNIIIGRPDAQATVVGNCEAVAGAVLNLATNGLHHAGADAHITIDATIRRNEVEIRVGDNGPGVQNASRDRIFEPFYTSRPDGTGLGLAVARSVAEAHGGSLALEPSAAPGATFVLRLPVSAEQARMPNRLQYIQQEEAAL